MRKALPIALIITVGLLGCTTNRTPGNGEPGTSTPSYGPAATPGSSSGSNVPMSSSYSLPSTDRLTADQAAALLRERQAYQGRNLGFLSPTGVVTGPVVAGVDQPTGQFISPSMQVNPQITVNSSISSGPTPVVSSGAGGDAGGAVGAVTGAFVLPGGAASTSVATTGATTAAATIGTNAALSTPATAATAATPGTFAAGITTLTPTMTSGATASPIAASSRVSTPVTSTTIATTTPATTTAAATTGGSATAGLSLGGGNGTAAAATSTTTPTLAVPLTVGATSNLTLGAVTSPIVIPSTNGTEAITVTTDGNTGTLVISNQNGRARAVGISNQTSRGRAVRTTNNTEQIVITNQGGRTRAVRP